MIHPFISQSPIWSMEKKFSSWSHLFPAPAAGGLGCGVIGNYWRNIYFLSESAYRICLNFILFLYHLLFRFLKKIECSKENIELKQISHTHTHIMFAHGCAHNTFNHNNVKMNLTLDIPYQKNEQHRRFDTPSSLLDYQIFYLGFVSQVWIYWILVTFQSLN